MKAAHIRELDGVRGVSILLVLATHLLPLGPKALQLNAMTGLMGMSLFFCLSGFLITRFLWDNPDVQVFLVRRLARILPLLALYAVLVLGLVLGRWDAVWGALTATLNYRDALLFDGSAHLWSICVELHFYLGIALAVALAGRRGFWIVPLATLAVLAWRIHAGAEVSIRSHERIDEILVGSLWPWPWPVPITRWRGPCGSGRCGRPGPRWRFGWPLAILWAETLPICAPMRRCWSWPG